MQVSNIIKVNIIFYNYIKVRLNKYNFINLNIIFNINKR